jgi:hypothetical protein
MLDLTQVDKIKTTIKLNYYNLIEFQIKIVLELSESLKNHKLLIISVLLKRFKSRWDHH